jgi:hypothetical protein
MDFLNSQLSISYLSSPTGVILLDVENFPFKLDLAKYLKAYCQYPFNIKFAVANWHNASISKLDKYLHEQGYQLIHVPKEKNGADGQILSLGASLLLQYPHIKEAVIVSGDSIFNYLHQTFRSQGCSTYKIYHQSSNIYVYDFANDKSSLMLTMTNSSKKQSPEEILQNKIKLSLKKLIKDSKPVTLSQVSSQFKLDYQQSITEALKSNKLPKSASNFIKTSCLDTIDIQITDNICYLSIKNKLPSSLSY